MTTFAKDRLKAFVERIERLEEEKKAIADDIRDIYAEAKGNGYDVKALREIVKLRKVDAGERQEFEAIVDTYKLALGMIADLPLGEAAIARAVASPSVRQAVKKLGTPAELTEDEKAKGSTAAFVKGDTRMTIGLGGDVGKPKSRAAPAARPDDRVIAPPLPDESPVLNQIPIPAQPPVAQVGSLAGIGPALLHDPPGIHEWPDGAGPSLSMLPVEAAASDSSAPLSQRSDLGGADDLLDIPAFLRRTADNRVPA